MKKIIGLIIMVGIFLFLPYHVLADKPVNDHPILPEIPDNSGVYRDPSNPNLLVHVFVHHPEGKSQVADLSQCTDPVSDSIVSAAGWHLPSGNWVYNLNPVSVPTSVGGGNLSVITVAGFGQWNAALSGSASKPTLSEGLNTTKDKSAYDGLNVITWGRTSGSALATTYIRYYKSDGRVVDVDTIMNKRFIWSWNICGANSYDAQAVLTHELGHWYGLDDEYRPEYVNNTMYGYGYKGDLKASTIENGDKAGVQVIYP